MNRRNLIGLAALVAVSSDCSRPGAKLAAADDTRIRTRALGLTLLLTNKRFRAEFYADDPKNPTYGGRTGHPFKKFDNDMDRKLYWNIWQYYHDAPVEAAKYLEATGYALTAFANATKLLNADYNPPDCPCKTNKDGSSEEPSCPPVLPLLT